MGQAGVSLLEVLLGIAIAVPLTLSSVLGMLLAIRTSDAVETQQRMELALSSAAEDLKALPYVTCGTAEDYAELHAKWSESATDVDDPAAKVELTSAKPATATKSATAMTKSPGAVALPAVNVSSVRFWQGGSDFSERCDSDRGAQQLVLSVQSKGRTLTATVVVRDPAATGAKS